VNRAERDLLLLVGGYLAFRYVLVPHIARRKAAAFFRSIDLPFLQRSNP
jgi:hypothetical protein